jgi:hypothetical protein
MSADQQNREAFAAFVKNNLGDVAVMDNGRYISPKINNYWLLWEESRQRHSAQPAVPLTVRLASYPESNGKRNWTAMFARSQPWDGLIGSAGGITIAHGEYWNRVAYEAERARFLLGQRTTEPWILEYSGDIKTPEEWRGTDPEAAHGITAAPEKGQP